MIGQTLGHYRVIERLGQGGMGEVFLAEDTRLRRRVALKFLAQDLASDRRALARFQTEARAIAELNHPNICNIHDIGDHQGRPYIVLEYVEGPTLKERIAAGPMDVEEVLDVGIAIAAGLEAAHGRGIVHRDIKPANILMAENRTPKLVDFGLARTKDATQITATGTTLGTVGYMSPEQLRGRTVDATSDVWSLGVVLYECLTGKHPFGASSAEEITYRAVHESPEPPTALRTGIPLALESTVLRCLEKSTETRLQDARDLSAALRAVRTSSHTAISTERSRAPSRLGGRGLATLVGVILLVTAGLIVLRSGIDPAVPNEPRLAVAGFGSIGPESDRADLSGLLALVQAELAGADAYTVVSPEYLREIQQRSGQQRQGPLVLARQARASHVLTGEVQAEAEGHRLSWRIVETSQGDILRTGIVTAPTWSELAASTAREAAASLFDLVGMPADSVPSSTRPLGSDDPVAYGHYSAGMRAIELGEMDAARQELTRAVELDSTFAQAAFALSRTYDPNVEMERAKIATGLARRHRDRLGAREAALLDAYQLLLDYEVGQAINAYDRAVALWPDSREALLGLARTQFFFRYWRDALASALDGLRYYQADTDFVQIQVGSLVQLGRWSAALEAANSLGGTDSKLVDAAASVGDIHFRRGEFDLAEQSYGAALQEDAGDHVAMAGLARCSYGRGELDEAERIVSEFLASEHAGPEADFYLVGSYSGLGLSAYLADQGKFEWSGILAGSRIDQPMIRAANFLYARLPERALAQMDEDFEPEIDDGSSIELRLFQYDHLLRCWIGVRELAKADEGLARSKKIIDADPDLPRGFVQRWLLTAAQLEWKRGNIRAARDRLAELFREGFIRLGTVEVQTLELEAAVAEASGDRHLAIQKLEDLLTVFGSRTLTHFDLARLYELDGRPDRAREHYRRCLELWHAADSDYPYPGEVRAKLSALDRDS